MSEERIQLIIVVALVALLAIPIILNATGVAKVPMPGWLGGICASSDEAQQEPQPPVVAPVKKPVEDPPENPRGDER